MKFPVGHMEGVPHRLMTLPICEVQDERNVFLFGGFTMLHLIVVYLMFLLMK